MRGLGASPDCACGCLMLKLNLTTYKVFGVQCSVCHACRRPQRRHAIQVWEYGRAGVRENSLLPYTHTL